MCVSCYMSPFAYSTEARLDLIHITFQLLESSYHLTYLAMASVCHSINPPAAGAFPSPCRDASRINLGEGCEVISGTA